MGTKTQKLSNIVDQVVEWQSVFTGDGSTGLTAVAGRGYFIDTTSGAVTVTLPASPKIGDIVQLKDYARTWGTNAVSLASALFDGVSAQTPSFSTSAQTVTLVYMDGTKGWSLINEDTTTGLGALFVTATGGTVTTSGDYKIHSFTGDGCFVVSCGGNPSGSTAVDYLVVAGGGSGGTGRGGGGGAGGFRLSNSTCMPAPLTSPLANPTGITVTATTYPVTVGAGGGAVTYSGTQSAGNNGSNSIFSTITSAGGGGGGAGPTGCTPSFLSKDGGSGGGGNFNVPGDFGAGNTPPVSPPQGNNGAISCSAAPSDPANRHGGGGGGAGGAGGPGSPPNTGHECGGIGSYVVSTGFAGCNGTPGPVSCAQYFSGGGGAGFESSGGGIGGEGGGGNGNNTSPATSGTVNTGGGGGAIGENNPSSSGAGGKGIVIIRYKYQ